MTQASRSSPQLAIALVGATGHMGQAIRRAAAHPRSSLAVTVCMDTKTAPETVRWEALQAVVDFSLPGGLSSWLPWAVQHRLPAVIGVTGYSQAQQAQIREASSLIPIVYSSNFSVAVNLLLELAARSTHLASYGFEPVLTEQHAVHKKDTPSGTAKNLLARMEATGLLGTHGVELRSVREDAPDAIHHLCWQGQSESLTLLHHAKDRRPFALGALRAVAWVVRQTQPGLYDMPAVLGWESLLKQPASEST